MGVFKEEASAFETVERNQHAIYDDAADYGYSYNTDNVSQPIKNLIDAVHGLQSLDSMFPGECRFIRNRCATKDSVSLTIRIAWSQDVSVYHGTEYEISFMKTNPHTSLLRKADNAFISVSSKRYNELK